jgi:3-dehydroquinate dehydratase type I
MKLQQRFFGVIATIAIGDRDAFFNAIARAREMDGVGTIELRLDPFGSSISEMSEVLEGIPDAIGDHQAILTLRSVEEGGKSNSDYFQKLEFWQGLPDGLRELIADPESNVFVDWDYSFVGTVCQNAEEMPFPWAKIGCSWHSFRDRGHYAPHASRMLRHMEATPAWAFLKIATMVYDQTMQMMELEHSLLAKSRKDTRPLIAFGMGKSGTSSRFDCLKWGSAGTYGYMPGLEPAAPGQVSVVELYTDDRVKAVLKKHSAGVM